MDVFLSYNRADLDVVTRIRARLTQRGIATFLDRDQLTPGLPWPSALEHALKGAKAVAVVLGPNGLGSWQKREIYFALDRQAEVERQGGLYPVIPVLLRGADRGQTFLFLNTWIDAEDDPESEEVSRALASSLTVASDSTSPRSAGALCPYVGLRPFREEDGGLFFGRDHFIGQLYDRVLTHRIVGLVGPSGSGKSSVALAGLIPKLRRDRPPRHTWDIAVMQPRDNPWLSFADSFIHLLQPEQSVANQLLETGKLAAALRDHPELLSTIIDHALTRAGGTDRIALIVDQFEELYTFVNDTDRRAFFDALLQTSSVQPLSVVLTIRADFYGPLIGEHRGLSDALSLGLVNVGPLASQELRAVIEKPAALAGLEFQSGLVNRILKEVVDQPGRLPLLQFALTGVWSERRASTLTHEGFELIGGVTGSIGSRAEVVYEQLSPLQKESAAVLMKRLVRVDASAEETTDTKRMVFRSELTEVAWEVAQLYAGPSSRLLVIDHDRHAATDTVEIAHEALIKNWARLRTWLDEDREFLLWLQRLRHAVEEWERTNRSSESLFRGQLLNEAIRWSKPRRGNELTNLERAFVNESQKADSRRRTVRKTGVATAAITLVAIAASALLVADGIRRRAEEVRARAALSAAESSTDSLLAAMLLLELKDTSPDVHRIARRVAADLAAPLGTFQHSDEVEAAFIAPRGEIVALIDSEGALVVYRSGQGSPTLTMNRKDEEAETVSFDATGQRLVAGFSGGTVLLWRLADLNTPIQLTGHTGEITSTAFSPDGSLVVTTSEDDTARLWNAADGAMIRVFSGHEDSVRYAAFSSEGSLVATAADDGTTRIWQVGIESPPVVLKKNDSAVVKVVFISDDEEKPHAVVTVSEDGTARVWPLEGDEAPIELIGGTTSSGFELDPSTGLMTRTGVGITNVFLGVAEATVLTISSGVAELRDLRRDAVRSAVFGGRRGIRHAYASPEGGTLLLGYTDHTIEVVGFDHLGTLHASMARRFKPHDEELTAVHLGSDGYHFVTSGDGGVVKVWRVDGSGEPVTPPDGDSTLSSDSSMLETENNNNDVEWVTTLVEPKRRFLFNAGWILLDTAPKYISAWDPLGRLHIIDVVTDKHVIAPDSDSWAGFSPDGSQFLTGSKGGLRLWNSDRATAAGQQIFEQVHTAAFSPDGSRAVGHGDGGVLLWDSKTQRSIRVGSGAAQARFTADGSTLLLLEAGKLQAYSPDGKPVALLGEKVKSFLTSKHGAAVLVQGDAGEIKVWTASAQFTLPKANGISNVEFSPDGSAVLLLSKEQGVQLWSRTSQIRQVAPKATEASFSHDGMHIWALTDGILEIFRSSETSQPVRLALTGAKFTYAEFNPRGNTLLTVSDDTAVMLWRAEGSLIELLTRGVDRAEFSADGRRIITTATEDDGEAVRVWHTELADVMHHIGSAVARTRRCLSIDQRESFLGESPEAAQKAFGACNDRAKNKPR